MAKIVIKDGVRYPEAFAERHRIKADETRVTGAERVRTTTAVGHAVVIDDVSGAVITSAADPSGADNSAFPVGENLGLAAPAAPAPATETEVKAEPTAAEKKAAAAAAKKAANTTEKGKGDGEAAAGDTAGLGDADGAAAK